METGLLTYTLSLSLLLPQMCERCAPSGWSLTDICRSYARCSEGNHNTNCCCSVCSLAAALMTFLHWLGWATTSCDLQNDIIKVERKKLFLSFFITFRLFTLIPQSIAPSSAISSFQAETKAETFRPPPDKPDVIPTASAARLERATKKKICLSVWRRPHHRHSVSYEARVGRKTPGTIRQQSTRLYISVYPSLCMASYLFYALNVGFCCSSHTETKEFMSTSVLS